MQIDPSPKGSVPFLNAEPTSVEEYPDIADIARRVSFDPATGNIWLHDQRMVMLHGSSFGEFRRVLIDNLGKKKARETLTLIGYQAGATDAALGVKLRASGSVAHSFAAGPQLLAIEGLVNSSPLKVEFDVAKGHWYGDFLWPDSLEAQLHVSRFGIEDMPVCWFGTGYASAFMGRPILYRELECRGLGHGRCRILGRPLDQWENIEEDLRYLQVEGFSTFRSPKRRRRTRLRTGTAPRAAAKPADSFGLEASGIVGASAGFVAAVHMLKKVAQTDATTLFLGESGVGKEMFSQTLHSIGRRRDKPFIAVNCAAIPEQLIEAELFGVERGAYTGATESRPGRFERADGGTLFLDEIATLSYSAQGKLLRALQEGEVERVGDRRMRKVDVRVIAATNIDLAKEVAEGRFRQDLYYRVNVFPIHIPPLRERRADIPLLMNTFLQKFTTKHGRRVVGFSEEAVELLLHYNWPGNIRELENMVERGVILAPENGAIQVYHLFTGGEHEVEKRLLSIDSSGGLVGMRTTGLEWRELAERALDERAGLDDFESAIVEAAVDRERGNLSAAARLLGLTRAQLAYKLKKRAENPTPGPRAAATNGSGRKLEAVR